MNNLRNKQSKDDIAAHQDWTYFNQYVADTSVQRDFDHFLKSYFNVIKITFAYVHFVLRFQHDSRGMSLIH